VDGAGREDELDPGLGRVLTVPNVLSLARLGLLCWFLVALFAERERILAAALLGAAGATDFLDGYVARRFDQVSTVGKVLDPTVDRIVVSASIIACAVFGAVPIWLVVVVLAREVATSSVALYVALARARRIDVLFIGKAGTFGLMVAFPLFLASDAPGSAWSAVRAFAWVLALPSLGCCVAATLAYLPSARRSLAEGREIPLGSQ
jgi:cardiolipin synthase